LWCDFTTPWDYENDAATSSTPSVDGESEASFCLECGGTIGCVEETQASNADATCVNCGQEHDPTKVVSVEDPAIELRKQQQAEVRAELKALSDPEPAQPAIAQLWDDSVLLDVYIFAHKYEVSSLPPAAYKQEDADTCRSLLFVASSSRHG